MLQGEHCVIVLTFIKLPFVIKIFVLSIFEWPFYTGFTAESNIHASVSLNLLNLLRKSNIKMLGKPHSLSLSLNLISSKILYIFLWERVADILLI